MFHNMFLPRFFEQNSFIPTIELEEFQTFNGSSWRKMKKKEMAKRGKDKMGCWNLLLDLPRIV